ncbi:hypothetical protein [Zobellia nedashkovskayae]|uniref:hypothetical protein n=1 Tax=Zobellia nedashkovskayae TaxID=2779510 RepID=UPI00188CEE4F|nr:hypothetical protein [Zobellia nedashkovskayae]
MTEKPSINKNFRGFVLFLVLMLLLYIGSLAYNNYVNKKIQNGKTVTIGRIIKIASGAKNLSVKYQFKLHNEDYRGALPIDNYPKINIVGKFFEVHVSQENPVFNKIFLDKEITDSIAILKAGFSFETRIKRNQFQD